MSFQKWQSSLGPLFPHLLPFVGALDHLGFEPQLSPVQHVGFCVGALAGNPFPASFLPTVHDRDLAQGSWCALREVKALFLW